MSLILLAGSILVSAAFYQAGLPFFFLFLAIPLIPFLSREKTVKECPVCGFQTTDRRVSFCPCDGLALTVPASP